MPKNLAKTYNPKEFETRIYEEWESNKAFAPGEDHTKKPFTIVLNKAIRLCLECVGIG